MANVGLSRLLVAPDKVTVLHRMQEQAKSRRSYGNGGLAERLRSGLQIREDRFDSGTRLHIFPMT